METLVISARKIFHSMKYKGKSFYFWKEKDSWFYAEKLAQGMRKKFIVIRVDSLEAQQYETESGFANYVLVKYNDARLTEVEKLIIKNGGGDE